MNIQEIIDIIEDFAPPALQANYDNSGLMCGDPQQELRSAVICLDVTEEIVDEAIRQGDNLIISHHPLIFSRLRRLSTATYIERSLIKAIKHDIVIYAAHTNMDAVPKGVSGRMADKLGLIRREILQPGGDPQQPHGFGIVGDLPEAVESMELLHHIKAVFQCPTLRYTRPHIPLIRRIALCGGAGVSLLQDAISQKADIFISGDFKYHDFFLAENHITIADIGHYESEQFTKEIFYELLIKKISKFAVRFSEAISNPINYL